MFRLILAALLPLGIWAHAHPRLAVLIAAAFVLTAAGVVKVLRDFGPPLAAVYGGSPSRRSPCAHCGWS